MEKIEMPTDALIKSYVKIFNEDKRYYSGDATIIKLFTKFPENKDFEDVLLKTIVINDLYSTNIFGTFKIAQVKTIRLNKNNTPKEDISFPTFKYEELIIEDWEDAEFKSILESKFFFVFYQYQGEELILRKATFWNMPYLDILEAKMVWDKMKNLILNGEIVREITAKGQRRTYFPKKSEYRVSHVRPHASNAADTYPLPVPDKLTGLKDYTKHCFWLNAGYVKNEIYEK